MSQSDCSDFTDQIYGTQDFESDVFHSFILIFITFKTLLLAPILPVSVFWDSVFRCGSDLGGEGVGERGGGEGDGDWDGRQKFFQIKQRTSLHRRVRSARGR